MKTYHAKEIQEKAEITKMQLGHWVNVGAIVPYKDDARRGGVRLYSQQNLVEAMICKELNTFRMEARVIAACVRVFRDSPSFWPDIKKDPTLLDRFIFLFIRIDGPSSKRKNKEQRYKLEKLEPKEGDKLQMVVIWEESIALVVSPPEEALSVFLGPTGSPSMFVLNLAHIVRKAGGI